VFVQKRLSRSVIGGRQAKMDTSGNPLILARLGVERLMLGVFGIS
jgi:hypothetical protein